ncbi:TPA: type 1 fimbrial protein [Salmonella enterica]|nr:type 1 fimbrial protein [Salmonella enterica]HEA0390773.1 type 1 fimbrial protein [Salmonella enterica]
MSNEVLRNSPHDQQSGQEEKKRTISVLCLLRATSLTIALMSWGAVMLSTRQAVAAGTASTTLTLKTRVTRATCDIHTPPGVISLPTINPGDTGGSEWRSTVTPLDIGVRCPSAPEEWVTLVMHIMPVAGSGSGDEEGVIVSRRLDNDSPGPDLFLTNRSDNDAFLKNDTVLARSDQDCQRFLSMSCLKMTKLSSNPDSYSLPVGVQMVIPVGDSRAGRLKPGVWQATATLTMTYQ